MKEDLRIKYKTSLEKTGNKETEASVLFNRNMTTILVLNSCSKPCSKPCAKPCSKPGSKLCSKPCSKMKKICKKNMSF